MLEPGTQAPDFSLPNQLGMTVQLSAVLADRMAVVFFYPHDTAGFCADEARAFRDHYKEFEQAGAEVLGISTDSIESHRAFSSEHRLPYPILCDAEKKVRKLYGVGRRMLVLPDRATFVIDRQRVIRARCTAQFNASEHALEALKAVRGLLEPAG